MWQQQNTYDAFGNITKSGSSSFSPTYSATSPNNQFTLSPAAFNSVGNMTSDLSNSYAWDAAWGTMTAVNGASYIYDALGNLVERDSGSSSAEILYSPVGRTAIMNGSTLTNAYIELPGGGTAIYNGSSSPSYYRHADWLGSARLTSTSSQTLSSSTAYGPFGEQYTSTTSVDASFTGQDADPNAMANTLYDFPARAYSPTMGRWISPDPSGMNAVDVTNPQTWNRYAYVANTPLTAIDPLGLNRIFCSAQDYGVSIGDGDNEPQGTDYFCIDVADDGSAGPPQFIPSTPPPGALPIKPIPPYSICMASALANELQTIGAAADAANAKIRASAKGLLGGALGKAAIAFGLGGNAPAVSALGFSMLATQAYNTWMTIPAVASAIYSAGKQYKTDAAACNKT